MKSWSQSQEWLIAPGFCSMLRLEVLLLLLDGMLVHRRSLPRNLLGFPNNLLIPVYTPGRREVLWELSVLPKNTIPCPQPGLEPGPLTPESNALTMRLPRLPPYRALLGNIKMECLRWPEKPFILERSGTQYVVMVTKRFSFYCGAHKNWPRYLFSSYLIKIWLIMWHHHLANLHIVKT